MRNYGAMDNEENIPQHTIRNILTRDFVLGFLALFAYMFAFFALVPILPVYLARLGSSEGEIGVLVGIYSVSSLVSRLLAGGALARYSEKRVMIFAALLFAITFLAYIILRPFWPFLVVRLFQGVAFACLDTAALAFVINVIPPAYRAQGLGYFLLAGTLALALAPPFGMFIINQYSFVFFFLTCIGLSLCTFFFSWKMKAREIIKPDKNTPVHDSRFLGLKIIVPGITSFLHNFVWGAIVAFLPLYAIRCGVNNPALFFSAVGVMLIVGRTLGGWILDTCSKEKIILAFIFTSIVAVVILSFSKTLPMFIFVGLLWGTGAAFIFPASMAYALEYAGSSDGPAVGTFRALMDLGVALGPMFMGIMIPLTSYRTMFLCLALICLINLCYFQFYVRKRRHVAPTV
jgi:predicted MFS family arabinose efflux permease